MAIEPKFSNFIFLELWVLSPTFRLIFGQGFFANSATNEVDFPNFKTNQLR